MINCSNSSKIGYLPSNIDLTNAVLRVLDRCSNAGSAFTSLSVTETVRLDNSRWIVYNDAVNRILEELFNANKVTGKVIDDSWHCRCKGNCFCMNTKTKDVLYKRALISDNGLDSYKYYIESE